VIKRIGFFVIILLLTFPVYAQMRGGMMGGGMMGNGMMGGRGYMNQPQEPQPSETYRALCNRCHGQGGNVIYPNLPLRGAPQLANFDLFLAFIRNPKMPDGSTGPMPPFPPDRISDSQAGELYQYLVNWLGGPQSQPGSAAVDEDRARAEVESYLKSTGNPNLKLGKVQDEGEAYQVEIVTKDGSLVNKILVNKNDGSMKSIY